MRTISYPIFLACRDGCADLFWKKIFENLAYGEAPKGITFKDNTLCSTTKKKEFVYSFQDKTAELVYQELYHILSQTFGIKTKSEYSRKKEVFDQFHKTNSTRRSEDVWGKIKKKSLKDNLLQDYCTAMAQLYLLDPAQMRKLYRSLTAGIVFKVFLPGDIHMENGEIKDIDGVRFAEHEVYIDRPFVKPSIKKQPAQGIYLLDLWAAHSKDG